jgi:hypothetical protein
MKLFKKLLLAGLVFTSVGAFAQTADEIAAKNVESMGGAAKLATLNTVKMTGSMSSNGAEFPITMTKTHMKGMRIDFEVMGTSNYQLANADKGFVFMPIAQMPEPKEMEADQHKSFVSQFDLQGVFANYKEKGTTIEILGTEKVEGAETNKLKVTFKFGKSVTYFVEKATGRVLKTISSGKGPDGSDMELETNFSDYKQNADGFWFPYTMTTPNGPLTFEKIETNVKVEETIYKP